jgi:hypothetical protein
MVVLAGLERAGKRRHPNAVAAWRKPKAIRYRKTMAAPTGLEPAAVRALSEAAPEGITL